MDEKMIGNENNIIFYKDENGKEKVEVMLQNENVWLNSNAISSLFDVERPAITKHINNIYKEKELDEDITCSILEHVGNNGKQVYNTKYYNLDMIISIGFRVNSKKAISFRIWANKILKDYIVQGFALDDDRFMKSKRSDQEYFKRLLEHIKLIRTSERMFYQKITDIFAECSIDYDKTSDIAKEFYSTIQNKFHYAITHHTAAELIYKRADAEKENMGLMSFKKSPDGKILKSDVTIAKNYLNETELKKLNNLVNIFLDVAENNAENKKPMFMKDWQENVEVSLKLLNYDILDGKGKISKKDADNKAISEYEKYKVIQDKEYVSDFDRIVKKVEKYKE